MKLLISKIFCPIKYIFLCWNIGLDDNAKMAFCESFLIHMKWKIQSRTLHPSSIYRRHYRTRPVRSLTTEVLFVRSYITENISYKIDCG